MIQTIKRLFAIRMAMTLTLVQMITATAWAGDVK